MQGCFATATYTVLRRTKEVELWEICHNLIAKMPKSYNRVSPFQKYSPYNIIQLLTFVEVDTMIYQPEVDDISRGWTPR